MAKDEKFKEGDIIEVVQLSSKKTHLSSTGQYYWYEDGLIPYIEDNADFGTNAVIAGYESDDDINEDIASE
jgi:hypothetical protein